MAAIKAAAAKVVVVRLERSRQHRVRHPSITALDIFVWLHVVSDIPGETSRGVHDDAEVQGAEFLGHTRDGGKADIGAEEAGVETRADIVEARGRRQLRQSGQQSFEFGVMAGTSPARHHAGLQTGESRRQFAVVDFNRHQPARIHGDLRLFENPRALYRPVGPKHHDGFGRGHRAHQQGHPIRAGIDVAVESYFETFGAQCFGDVFGDVLVGAGLAYENVDEGPCGSGRL
jgi:hypothetical protein